MIRRKKLHPTGQIRRITKAGLAFKMALKDAFNLSKQSYLMKDGGIDPRRKFPMER